MQNLSLRGEIESFFDDLNLIFVGTREGAVSGNEEGPTQGSTAPGGNGSRSGQIDRTKRCPRVPTTVEPMSVPLREREGRKGGKKRKGVKKSKPTSPALAGGARVSEKGSSTSDTSLTSPLVKGGGGSYSIDPTSHNDHLGLGSRARNDCGSTQRIKSVLFQYGAGTKRPSLES
ncbi:hypothetical protein AMTR_s00053p00156380 [Amborella trichopoda]|uniref:Uncharacterized protein n=1 Tax=Amborella trichopoda TaxID=13333 RepID=W1PAY4_AMBTC|nr:hypothetical protein AMTR_s00053p00156380 [Amborella trichopoda]